MSSISIKVQPTTAALGAVVSGIDLANPSSQDIDAIYEALLDHGVLFFRGQLLTDEEQANLATSFGNISPFPFAKVLGAKHENPTSRIIDNADSPPKADGWHTDITWIEEPPKMAFLQPIALPENGGGDTMWGCTYAAYEKLSPAMTEFLNNLTVRHSMGEAILNAANNFGPDIADKLKEAFAPVVHPLIRTHPDTKKQAIYFGGEFMESICELEKEESNTLLFFLNQHINNPNFHIRWSWELGDLAIWDERRTIHRALSDHYPQHREMRRCTVDGDKPFYSPS